MTLSIWARFMQRWRSKKLSKLRSIRKSTSYSLNIWQTQIDWPLKTRSTQWSCKFCELISLRRSKRWRGSLGLLSQNWNSARVSSRLKRSTWEICRSRATSSTTSWSRSSLSARALKASIRTWENSGIAYSKRIQIWRISTWNGNLPQLSLKSKSILSDRL